MRRSATDIFRWASRMSFPWILLRPAFDFSVQNSEIPCYASQGIPLQTIDLAYGTSTEASDGDRIADFPVFLSVSRELLRETGSRVTAFSCGASAAN
jgi:hypothetical protein